MKMLHGDVHPGDYVRIDTEDGKMIFSASHRRERVSGVVNISAAEKLTV